MKDGKKKIIDAKGIRQENTVRKEKGEREREESGRKTEQLARTNARTRGGKMASRRAAKSESISTLRRKISIARETRLAPRGGRQRRFAHLLVLAFVLKHHHSVPYCLGRHFFFHNQFPCSR